jgi:di/tricarboxylate transporter
VTWQAWATAAIAIGAMAVFASEKVRADLVALMVLAALAVLRIIDVNEALAGFSNEATVTVAAMFVLSLGIARSGALDPLMLLLARIRRPWLLSLALMLVIAPIGAFVKNTALVATFLPLALRVCARTRTSPARVLMPMAFAAQMGGVCTLLGTSSNLLADALARGHGLPGFGVFEFAPLGAVLAVAGIVYMMLVGRWLLPKSAAVDKAGGGTSAGTASAVHPAYGDSALGGHDDGPHTPRHALIAVAILAAVVLVSGLRWLPIPLAAVCGAIAMGLAGVFTRHDVYADIDWKIIIMLGAILPLGIAIEKTGLADVVVHGGIHLIGNHGPFAALLLVYALTALLTELMGHNPSVVLMTGIAVSVARALHMDPTAYIVCVAFAAATSFATPVGYPTNTMVYYAGNYRFTDFMKVGIPLIALFCVLSMLLIPHWWPLTAN